MAIEKYIVKHAALTDIGLKRSRNEDSIGFIEIEDGYVFVVCDGMGGHEGGEIASKTAVRAIIEYLNSTKIENVSVSLHQAITFANKEIYSTAINRPDLKGMGTTVVVLLIYKDEIYTAHVGDSRIYALSDRQFFQISKDHSVVQEMIDNGIIQPHEAENHPRKNEITRALGVKQEVIPAINNKVLKAKVGDRFVICSDGLHGMINTLTFSTTVQQFANPDECAAKLIALAKEGGGDDNISVQIIDITESPFTESYYPTQPQLQAQPSQIKLEEKTTLPEKKRKFSVKQISIILGLLIVAGIAFGIYKFTFHKKEGKIENSNSKNKIDSTNEDKVKDSAITANKELSENKNSDKVIEDEAAAKKRIKFVKDSIIKDKKIKEQKTKDSLTLALRKKKEELDKRGQEIADSIKKIGTNK
ncbi:MAG: Stp1/IreP family PP2C-type Ser/Thr phosphatase [Chitinophagales bacterium]